jgi:glycosyltransferase involved in cell wall biosynthesis
MINVFPTISLVTPSYNQAQFLEATIESVLSQNYPNLEYIIIDGGSTDGSVEILKKYENHLAFWCSEPDGGQYDAINKGFARSSGEIMAWLNSDDMYFPWTFRTVASIMSELPQVEWLTTLRPGFWDWYGFCIEFSSMLGYCRQAFLDGCYFSWGKNVFGCIQQESTFWRRNLWQKVGSQINTDFKMAGDFDLWSRFFLHTDLYGTSSPLGGFRKQINQRSRKSDRYIIEAESSLSEMRTKLNWSPIFSKSTLRQLKIQRIPKIQDNFISLFGYVGKRIIRENLDLPSSYWKIEEYKFL